MVAYEAKCFHALIPVGFSPLFSFTTPIFLKKNKISFKRVSEFIRERDFKTRAVKFLRTGFYDFKLFNCFKPSIIQFNSKKRVSKKTSKKDV